MKVGDVMTTGVELVSPEATIQEAAVCMAELDVGAILVGADGKVEGVLTDRDVLLRVVVAGSDPKSVRVRDVMSSERLFTCRDDDGIEAAFHKMSEHQVRRLPVYDQEGRLKGIVTLGDLTRMEHDPGQALEALRMIAEPHRSKARA
jgi:CBS domain-containing protein